MSYQSVYYDYKEKLYYLRDEDSGWKKFQYSPTYYKLDPKGTLKTLFGDSCSPIQGRFDWSDPNILEKDINKELLILRDLYYKNDKLPKWQNIVYLDIEIETISALLPENIRQAEAEITAIALIDCTTKRKICFILDKSREIENLDDGTKVIISCPSEKDLMLKFLEKWEEMDPTIVSHYNGDYFDIPYLFFRMRKIIGNKAYGLSPIGKIIDSPQNPMSPIRIGGVNCLDFMLLIKKYISKEEPSYKLGDIGTKYVELGKINYDGSLNKLFQEDKEKFIEYNLRDVEIIEALEEKLKFIQLTILISHLCHTPYESIFYNTVLNDGAILTYLKRKNIVAPNKPTTTNPEIKELNIGDNVINQRGTPTLEGSIVNIEGEELQIRTKSNKLIWRNLKTVRKYDPYAGGYLLDPIPGLYEDVIDLDYSSLYPSVIKSLNLGIDTLIGRIITKDNYDQNHSLDKLKQLDPNKELSIQKLSYSNYKLKNGKIKVGDLIELIEENNWNISASGAFFRTDIKSIAAEVLEDWFKQREHYRELKKKAGKEEKWEEYKLYDLYQHAFKILQNALYGGYAINSWRFTDGYKICSSAITNSGQRLDKSVIEFCNEKISKELSKVKNYVIAADTDSAYIEIKDLLKHRFGNNLDPKDKETKILEIAKELQDEANQNLTQICKVIFNIKENKYFELKQEVIIARAYWSGKRRYAMWVTNKEGVPIPSDHKDALDMKGLDIMKSNMTPIYREFGKKLLIDILHGSKKPEIDKRILDFKNYLKSQSYQTTAKPTGVKKIREYILSPPPPGTIFSRLVNKCPINSKAGIYYNDLLRFKKLDSKYSVFMEGDKMNYCNLVNNPYRIDVLAFRGKDEDPPFIKEILEKYADTNLGFESVLLNKLQNIYKDLNWEFINLNPYSNKFFKF
jgi:DNA polymerase elongation subunit (family B)